jgi:hypothetical protein
MRSRIHDHLARCLLLSLVSCLAACSYERLPTNPSWIEGIVVLAQPIINATIQVYRMDETGGYSGRPAFETKTDAYGRFELTIGNITRVPGDDRKAAPVLVLARGGQTFAPGSSEVIMLDNRIHTEAVVVNLLPSYGVNLTMSPLTTLTKALADERLARGLESTYTEAGVRARELMDAHFMVDLHGTVPAPFDVPAPVPITPEVQYMLALAGLWSMEQSMAARSGITLPTWTLLEALKQDLRGPDAVFDGRGLDGVISLGNCTPACELGPQTLRFDLTETLMVDFIPSVANGTGLDYQEIATYLYWLAGSMDPALFGDEPALGFDDTQPPVAAALASPFFDESENLVRFDARLRAVHEHTPAALVDLAATLAGPCDQVLHKHVDTLLADPDANPLRWRLAVLDDLTGVGAADIRAVLRPGGAGPGYELAVSPAAGLAGDAGRSFDIVAPGYIPELAQVEGRFELEIQAGDRQGNLAAPVVGCWQHVPLAAPVHQAPLVLAAGPGSFAAVNLDNDDVATLLGGALPASLGLPLARIPVDNGSGTVVYLTPHLDEVTGTYDRTWIAARAFVRADDSVDACIAGDPPTCATELPRAPRLEDRVIAQPLPALTADRAFLGLRVVDAQSGQVVTCDECRPGEARLDPGRSYEVQVVATTLEFLVPAGVDPARVARIQVGPSNDRHRLVGIVDEVAHVVCADPDQAAGLCRGHRVFDLYQALIDARIDIQSTRISARTAPGPSLPPRTPRPATSGSDGTFSLPLSTSYEWSAIESRIPAEGGL